MEGGITLVESAEIPTDCMQSGGTPGSPEAHDRKAAMNEAGLAVCGDVGEWLGVDSGKKIQVRALCMHFKQCS